jgi:GT2 family glycosyltransferase
MFRSTFSYGHPVKLSVVLGTCNRLAQLQACIESIFDQTTTKMCVYVTDAGSTDGAIEYLESVKSERLVPILMGTRLGQAKAYNEVFARIESPYVCWLSDDNVIVNGGLDVATKILDENQRIGMVGLKVKDMTGPFVDAPYIGGVSSTGILNVNQGLLRTTILKEVGGFSEGFRDYGIDPDLTAKVIFSGYQVCYTRKVAIHHYRNWSVDPSSEDYHRQMQKQETYLALYREKYRNFISGGIGWKLKKLSWNILQHVFRSTLAPNSQRHFLGLLVRDWHNIFSGRFISLWDPLVCKERPYHLVQYCPSHLCPELLPFDPVKHDTSSPSSDNSKSTAHAR